eukprot:jgi/Picsp_1/2304/NSC_05768-R1_acyl- synthetase
MESLMQNDWPLVVSKIIDYAATWHGDQKVICRTTEGPIVESTYEALWTRSAQCAMALRRLGVRPGDRVATLAWNTTRHLECWYGIAGMGGVCHTVNPRLFEHDIAYIMKDAEDVVVMADLPFVGMLERVVPQVPSVRQVVVLTDRAHMPGGWGLGSSPPLVCYEDWVGAEPVPREVGSFAWHPSRETDACGLCYTSGTTGRPKGVLYGHRSNFLHAMAMCFPDGLDLRSTSCFLMVVPMFHANSWGTAFALPLVGGRLVLPGPWMTGPDICMLVDRYRVTHSGGVPTVWQTVKDHIETENKLLESLQILVISGSSCPLHLIHFYKNAIKADVRHVWGMTELSPVGSFGTIKGSIEDTLSREEKDKLRLTQGRPHIFCEYRLVDDTNNTVPHDGKSPGNLQVRGPTAVKRYFKMQEDCVHPGNWFDTGDIASIDSNGYMLIRDRSKDVIKSGGEWISSIEIENLVAGHPGVSEVAVVAISHAKWGERPLLVVVRSRSTTAGGPVTKQDLLRHLEGTIAPWWMPDDVVFVDAMPHTATGKIQKLQLRQQFKDFQPALGSSQSGPSKRLASKL